MYAEITTFEGQLEDSTDQSDSVDKESITAQRTYLDAFEEVIRIQ